jgi:chromosome partitioning protein
MFKIFPKKTESTETIAHTISQNGRVISVLNQKGGVGKTTMAFNLARALKESGKKVLMIDMDPQANLTLLCNVSEEKIQATIFQALVNSIKELKPLHRPTLLSEVIIKGEGNMPDLIASSQDLSGFELTVAGITFPRQLILKNYMTKSQIMDLYDAVVIDGPPTLGLLMVNILCASQGVVVPFQADQFSELGLENFHQVLEDIEDMGITEVPKILGYVPNMFDQRRKQSLVDLDKIKSKLAQQYNSEPHIFEPFANKVQLVKSSSQKKSVFDFATVEFKDLQKQFLDIAHHIGQELQ